MKRPWFLFFSLALTVSCISDDSLTTPDVDPSFSFGCPRDVRLTTQGDVDEFSCTEVLANLRIGSEFLGNYEITNLDGLAELTSVSGDLLIEWNWGLANLDGLGSLETVGGDFILTWNGEPGFHINGLA